MSEKRIQWSRLDDITSWGIDMAKEPSVSVGARLINGEWHPCDPELATMMVHGFMLHPGKVPGHTSIYPTYR